MSSFKTLFNISIGASLFAAKAYVLEKIWNPNWETKTQQIACQTLSQNSEDDKELQLFEAGKIYVFPIRDGLETWGIQKMKLLVRIDKVWEASGPRLLSGPNQSYLMRILYVYPPDESSSTVFKEARGFATKVRGFLQGLFKMSSVASIALSSFLPPTQLDINRPFVITQQQLQVLLPPQMLAEREGLTPLNYRWISTTEIVNSAHRYSEIANQEVENAAEILDANVRSVEESAYEVGTFLGSTTSAAALDLAAAAIQSKEFPQIVSEMLQEGFAVTKESAIMIYKSLHPDGIIPHSLIESSANLMREFFTGVMELEGDWDLHFKWPSFSGEIVFRLPELPDFYGNWEQWDKWKNNALQSIDRFFTTAQTQLATHFNGSKTAAFLQMLMRQIGQMEKTASKGWTDDEKLCGMLQLREMFQNTLSTFRAEVEVAEALKSLQKQWNHFSGAFVEDIRRSFLSGLKTGMILGVDPTGSSETARQRLKEPLRKIEEYIRAADNALEKAKSAISIVEYTLPQSSAIGGVAISALIDAKAKARLKFEIFRDYVIRAVGVR